MSVRRRAVDTEALIVGYAMSRLDTVYLASRGLKTWREAFAEAARVLGRPPATYKNLRDEFDLVHGNARRGWVRPGGLRANRQRVLGDLSGASDAAVLALADRILAHDEESVREAVVSLADEARPAAGVAQRLLTGRLAEEYFMANVGLIVGRDRADLVDLRNAAAGFDFGIGRDPRIAYEVKGLRGPSGGVLFTDLEWRTAGARGGSYVVVVVADLDASPRAALFPNPHRTLPARLRTRPSVSFEWAAEVARADTDRGVMLASIRA